MTPRTLRRLGALTLPALLFPVVCHAQATQPPVDLRVETQAVFERLKAAAGPQAAGVRLRVITDITPYQGYEGKTVFVSDGALLPLQRGAAWLTTGGPERHGGRSAASLRQDMIRLQLAHEVAGAVQPGTPAQVDARGLQLFERAGGDARPAEVRRLLRGIVEFPAHSNMGYTQRLLERFKFWQRVGETLPPELRRQSQPAGPDRYAAFRRADGTIDWKRFTAQQAGGPARGLLHFGLAAFLKEVVLVAQTGERSRIEAFFDGLTQTDFYVHYGLFSVGAGVADAAYVRYLQRYVKPGFVNGLLRNNLVLASGMLLPGLVSGASPRQMAISMTALGLSSAAVQAGMAPIRWGMSIDVAANKGVFQSMGISPRFARFTGWVYVVVETAVVLYAAERIEGAIESALDEREARGAVSAAGYALLAEAAREDTTPARLEAALGRADAAFRDFREQLLAPARESEAAFARTLSRLAREAKLTDDVRRARRLAEDYPALQAWARRNAARLAEEEAAAADVFARRVGNALESFQGEQAVAMGEAFGMRSERGSFEAPYLSDAPDLAVVFGRGGGLVGQVRRRLDTMRLRGSLRRVSKNRLETYDDEARLLEAAAGLLRARGREDLAAVVARGEDLARTREQERALYEAAARAPAPTQAGMRQVLDAGQ